MHDELALLRVGFDHGLFTREDVRHWVDRQLETRDVLPSELLDLTTLAHKRDDEIVKLLAALESPSTPCVLARLTLAVFAALYRRGNVSMGDCIARLASLLSWSDGLTGDERARLDTLECAYDLAVYGTYGSVEDVEDDLKQFLSAYELPRRFEST